MRVRLTTSVADDLTIFVTAFDTASPDRRHVGGHRESLGGQFALGLGDARGGRKPPWAWPCSAWAQPAPNHLALTSIYFDVWFLFWSSLRKG